MQEMALWQPQLQTNEQEWQKSVTANLNEKNLATNSPWDFDANFDTSDPNWLIPDQKFFYLCRAPVVNPG